MFVYLILLFIALSCFLYSISIGLKTNIIASLYFSKLRKVITKCKINKLDLNVIKKRFPFGNKVQIGTCLPFVLMMLVCAFRGIDCGTDTSNYYEGFKFGSERMEPIFQLILFFCKYLDLEFQWLLIFYAILTYVPLIWIVRKTSVDVNFSSLIFLTFSVYFYHETFNTIRVSAAIMYFLISLYFFSKKKYKEFVLWFFIATMFHYSTILTIIILVPAYLFKKVSVFWVNVALVVSVCVGLVVSSLFAEALNSLSEMSIFMSNDTLQFYNQNYLQNVEESSLNIVGVFSNLLPFTIFTSLMTTNANIRNINFRCFALGVIISNVFISINLVYRVTMFFTILIVFLLPNTFYKVKPLRKTCLSFMTALMIIWYLYQLIKSEVGDLAGTIPYTFFFD